MNPIRVIGIGSPFGDDQLGWYIVDALEQCPYLPATWYPVSFIKADRPGINLLELMRYSDTVVIVDAMKSGAQEGTVRRFTATEIEGINTPVSSHGFGVAAALAMARALDQMPERLVLYGIEAGETGIHKCVKSGSDIDNITRIIATDLMKLQL